MVEPGDEGVGVVSTELLSELLDDLSEPDQVSRLDGLGELQVGMESGLQLKYRYLSDIFSTSIIWNLSRCISFKNQVMKCENAAKSR